MTHNNQSPIRLLFLKLPPPPCAVLLVHSKYNQHRPHTHTQQKKHNIIKSGSEHFFHIFFPFQQFVSTRWVSQSAFCEAVWQGHYLARVSSNLYPTLLSILFLLACLAFLLGFLRVLAFCACPPFCHCLPFVTACFLCVPAFFARISCPQRLCL